MKRADFGIGWECRAFTKCPSIVTLHARWTQLLNHAPSASSWHAALIVKWIISIRQIKLRYGSTLLLRLVAHFCYFFIILSVRGIFSGDTWTLALFGRGSKTWNKNTFCGRKRPIPGGVNSLWWSKRSLSHRGFLVLLRRETFPKLPICSLNNKQFSFPD